MTNEYAKYLAHHGIKGQKWGERNGPPYPLGASGRSAAERKAALDSSRKKKLKSQSNSESQEKQAYGSAKKNLENALKNRNDEKGMVDAWKKYSDAHDKYLNSIDPSTLKKVGVGAAVTVGVVGVGAALYLNREKLGPVLANLPNPARQKIIEGKIDKIGFDFDLSNMARKTTSIDPSLLPDEDTYLGIDTVFHRMSGDGLLQPENADHDCIFASFKPNDVDLYKMMYPLFDSNNSGSNTFKDLTLALKEPVKIPSAKKRFDTYAELLGEKSKAGDAVRSDFLKMIDPEQLAIPGYKDMVTKQIMADPVGYASRHYRLLVSRGNSTRSAGNREFFKRLISKGYNAVTDDCDAGVQADHPVIFMKNIVRVVDSKDVSTKSKDYFEATYRAVPVDVDDSDKSLFTLFHHGIKGQKWGKRNGPPYPLDEEDYSVAEKKAASSSPQKDADKIEKGTKFQRISTKAESTPKGDRAYLSYTERDNDYYTEHMTDFRGGVKNMYKVSYEAVKDIYVPKHERQVDEFLNLYRDKKVMVVDEISEELSRRQTTSLLDAKPEYISLGKDYIHNTYKQLYKEEIDKFDKNNQLRDLGYQYFMMAYSNTPKIRAEYQKRLKDQGYNAIVDDNDVRYNDMFKGKPEKSVIVFDPKDNLKISGSTKLTQKEYNKAKKRNKKRYG